MVRHDDRVGRCVQPRLDVIEAQDRTDVAHVEGSVAERNTARDPEARCDFAHLFATAVAIAIRHREDAAIPAGADEERALVSPGHLPSIRDLREQFDDESLGEADLSQPVFGHRAARTKQLCSGKQEQGGEARQHSGYMLG